MAVFAPISAQRAFATTFASYGAATLLRELAKSDDQVERAEAAIEPLFDLVMTHDAADLGTIISKCSAILTEYGAGECPTYLVEALMLDLMALESLSAQ